MVLPASDPLFRSIDPYRKLFIAEGVILLILAIALPVVIRKLTSARRRSA